MYALICAPGVSPTALDSLEEMTCNTSEEKQHAPVLCMLHCATYFEGIQQPAKSSRQMRLLLPVLL